MIRGNGGSFRLVDTSPRSTNFPAGISRIIPNYSGAPSRSTSASAIDGGRTKPTCCSRSSCVRQLHSPANVLAGHNQGTGTGAGVRFLKRAAEEPPGRQDRNEQHNRGQQIDVSRIVTPADFPAHRADPLRHMYLSRHINQCAAKAWVPGTAMRNQSESDAAGYGHAAFVTAH